MKSSGSQKLTMFEESQGEVLFLLFFFATLLYFYSEHVSYHWIFSSVGLLRTVHWLFEVASKRKWGRKSIIDFAFCLTQTLRKEKHIRS